MRKQDLMRVLQAPIISEKSSVLADQNHQFVFRVKSSSDKAQVKRAVEVMFNVEVEDVRILNVKGKEKRFGRYMGKRSDWKKAYVSLKPGFNIDLATS